MLLAARKSPRLSLRKAASYNASDRGPQSSTSARFSFHHLIASPPPSPSLPALIPRHGKPPPARSPRRFLKGFLWLLGVLLIGHYGVSFIDSSYDRPAVGWPSNAADEYEMVGEAELPDFPTPLVFTDKRGRTKWSVSIPSDAPFPLPPKTYAEICSQNAQVSMHVATLHEHHSRQHTAHYDYYHVDPNFMDVAEAEAHGLLPGEQGGPVVQGVCEKSMTFVLETSDAGLGKTLMMLWTAYGLAQKEERAFFVDDSRWAYGRYTKYFQPPPAPKCRPPPHHQMLPCPHHARHLVVSAATVTYMFGGAFNEYFEDARKMEVYRLKPIFQFARAGYEALFNLAPEDDEYVSSRIATLQNRTEIPAPREGNGMILGLHVRRGDRHPYEFQYRDSYVPLDRYSAKAREFLLAAYGGSAAEHAAAEDVAAEMHSLMVVASDDPDVYSSDEFSHAARAQDLIALASKSPSSPDVTERLPIRRFVEEAVGWEGGFFAGMFWSLGQASSVPAVSDESHGVHPPPTESALHLRELVGRAYLLDLAVLGGASDKVVCTVSSTGCRLLAVMMGWDRAVVEGSWVNIDGDFDWRGVAW